MLRRTTLPISFPLVSMDFPIFVVTVSLISMRSRLPETMQGNDSVRWRSVVGMTGSSVVWLE